MPVYKVDIEKRYSNEYWTNRYFVEAPDMAEATDCAQFIVSLERAIHWNLVIFTKFRVSDNVPNTEVFNTVTLNLNGQQNLGGEPVPLFVVARVDFSVANQRPSRKYLRGVLHEGSFNYTNVSQAIIDFIKNSYADPLVALGCVVDEDGNAFGVAGVSPFVGMRQLRRGSKRRENPIIPPP